MQQHGIPLKSFSHYSFNAGENKGQAPTEFSKQELTKAMNVENRGLGITTRYGCSVTNVDAVTTYPSPIVGNPTISSIFGITYGASATIDALFTAGTTMYRDQSTPTALKVDFTVDAQFQYARAADYFYIVNGIDLSFYYDPSRSTTSLYTSGYETPSTFTATPGAGGSMANGTYQYYVTLYDANTLTESNRQDVAVSAVVAAGPAGSVTLTNLPLDSENRTTHWRIYRLDPTGYYHYDLIQIPYVAGTPSYTDTFLQTGSRVVAPTDNFRPDVSDCICKHGTLMVYAKGNVITWSKNYRYQNVPTENREILEDNSQNITKMLSFRGVLVIWKTDSIYTISGDLNRGTYKIEKISGYLGTKSPRTVCEGPDGIFFLDSRKRPRFINSTDFSSADLRDSTDIAFKYRLKFDQLSSSNLPNCHAVVWENSAVSQWRVFLPIETSNTACDHCFVFDMGLYTRNGGDSAWFDFHYQVNITCSDRAFAADGSTALIAGDNWGLLWRLDKPNIFYDGDQYFRAEGAGTIALGATTVTISGAGAPTAPVADQFKGMQLIMYDRFTYVEIFRSRITTNSTTVFTVEDTIPTLPTADPAVCVGGYLTYFATANYTHNRSYRNRSFKMSMLFNQEYDDVTLQAFVWMDFVEAFNYTYSYLNNPANSSLSSKTDNYTLAITNGSSTYDAATSLYDVSRYGISLYGTDDFLLKSDYLWNHIAWGVVTREPSQPFAYLGATLYYQTKGLTQ